MAETVHDRIKSAIYTEERALWLDPEDADAITEDAAKALGLDLLATAGEAQPGTVPTDLVLFLQEHRRKALRAIRASAMGGTPDYWRWQGHAELSRQLLERLGAEVPA